MVAPRVVILANRNISPSLMTAGNVWTMDARDRFKFVDDMSLLEVVNLLACGLSSYNFKNHVASDIAVGSSYLPPQNIESQTNLDSIQQWTDEKKMLLNKKKSNYMVFNYTKKTTNLAPGFTLVAHSLKMSTKQNYLGA